MGNKDPPSVEVLSGNWPQRLRRHFWASELSKQKLKHNRPWAKCPRFLARYQVKDVVTVGICGTLNFIVIQLQIRIAPGSTYIVRSLQFISCRENKLCLAFQSYRHRVKQLRRNFLAQIWSNVVNGQLRTRRPSEDDRRWSLVWISLRSPAHHDDVQLHFRLAENKGISELTRIS